MSVFLLREVEELVQSGIPDEVVITGYRTAGTKIVFNMEISGNIPYQHMEAMRQDWEQKSGWNVAIDTFYHSPGIDRQAIETVLSIVPSNPDIKEIRLNDSSLLIYTLDVAKLFGRENRIFMRLRSAFPGKHISIQAANARNASPNLQTVDRAITKTLDCEGVLGQVRGMVPKEYCLRSVAMHVPSRTLTLTYGTPRLTGPRLQSLTETVESATGWNIILKKVVDWTEALRRVRAAIPDSLPGVSVGAHEETDCVLIDCLGDLTHEPILKELAARLSRELPVTVWHRLRLRDERKSEIIRDIVPQEWGLERIGYNHTDKIAVLNCTNPPKDGRELPIFAEINARIGWRAIFKESVYERVNDPKILSAVREHIPVGCGFEYVERSVLNGDFRIFIRRHPETIKVRELKKTLGTKQVAVKIVKDEANKSAAVKQMLNAVDIGAAPEPIRVRTTRYARFTGFGACEEVGRSCFYLELSGLKILLDCGASFGLNPYPQIPLEIVRELDFVFLSHAHTDHSALIPWLYAKGCRAQLFATEPTLAIAQVLMRDYIKVQELYRHEVPAYKKADIAQAFRYACLVNFDQRYAIGDNAHFTFFPAGHILGAAMILFEDGNERLLYSGDISCVDSRVLQKAKVPTGLDHIIIEATYGGKQHGSREEAEQYFLKRLEGVLEEGGTVIVPTFAVGRSQEILAVLSRHPKMGYQKKFPIWIDGMVKTMNDIHRSYLISDADKYRMNPQLKAGGQNIFTAGRSFFFEVARREMFLNNTDPKVMITTSGMCEGLASYYLSGCIENPRNLLMIVGYQTEGTLGRLLLEGAEQVSINGRLYRVNIQVDRANFSGHADEAQLIAAIKPNKLKTLITVHGEAKAMESFTSLARKTISAKRVIQAEIGKEVVLY